MIDRKFKRRNGFNLYKESGKIISERRVKIVFDDEQDVRNALQEVRQNLKMAELQKNSLEEAIENYKKEERALLSYLESQIK